MFKLLVCLLILSGASAAAEGFKLKGVEFVEQRERKRVFKFRVGTTSDYQITIQTTARGKQSGAYKIGDVIDEGFEIVSYEFKEGVNEFGIVGDASELTILDKRLNRKFTLVYNRELNWPDRFAGLRREGGKNLFHVREGEEFNLPSQEGPLTVESVSDSEVRISNENGDTAVLKKAPPEVQVEATVSEPPEEFELAGVKFLDQRQRNRVFTFKASGHPDYQITVQTTARGKKTGFYKIGDVIAERFKIIQFEQKEGTNQFGIVGDFSELTILDQKLNLKFTLQLKLPVNRPDFFAELQRAGEEKVFHVQEGDDFTLPGYEGKLKVKSVTENDVSIVNEKGEVAVLGRSAKEE